MFTTKTKKTKILVSRVPLLSFLRCWSYRFIRSFSAMGLRVSFRWKNRPCLTFCRCDADAWWRTRCPVDSFFEYQLTRVIKSQKTLRDTFILLITHRWISAGRTGVNRIEIYSTDTHTHRTQQNTLTLTQNTARHGTHEELVFVFYFLIRHQKIPFSRIPTCLKIVFF